jgi:hypothetical protein
VAAIGDGRALTRARREAPVIARQRSSRSTRKPFSNLAPERNVDSIGVRGSQVDPVLGREVVEGEQLVPVAG